MTYRPIGIVALLLPLLVASSLPAAVPDEVRFNQHVRPILSNCFYCHGPDEKHREADLRLDTREGATAAAIVPGQPDESVLLDRVASHDESELMPPPASKRARLTAEQIATLRRWIEQGAEYEGHWAFLPLASDPPPAVKNQDWPHNPIDQFILARLEREGIAPSPEADEATLIRRVTLDLTGLLPTPKEVETFTREFAAQQEQAYAALVGRLLDSPHYGERWGRHWLDQARYADSNGYTIDSQRAMWPYRDWVIQALNDDQPFDQFTIEQLAGDLLPEATKKQIVASAFHRNTLINEEGGTDPEQFRHEAVVDRVNTTAAVWLGLTVGCAQCHTHKFDPITHREYYELFAFFNSTTDVNNKGATLGVAPGEMFGEQPETLPPLPEADEHFAQRKAQWERQQAEQRAASDSSQKPQWQPLTYIEFDTATGAGLKLLEDNSLLADGRGADNETYRVVAKTDLAQIAALRLRVLTHESLPKQGPGLAGNGNFVLTRLSLSAAGAEQPFASAWADHEQPKFAISGVFDDDPGTGWAINVGPGSTAKMNAGHQAVLVLEKSLAVDGPLEVKLFHELNDGYLVGRFALEASATIPPSPATIDDKLAAALTTPDDKRTPAQAKLVRDAFIAADPPSRAAQAKRDRAIAKSAALMVMKELDQPRETFVALRGDFLRPDKALGPLQPGGLSFVAPPLPAQAGRTRLDLARWLVHPENPLTPRVTMNRIWMRYFGRGLVETEEDFGSQGSQPTHPELLDWLAGELIRQGWSQKAMHRLIVSSSTYRQASKHRPELTESDPRNLLLARQERLRVEAEVVRDAALSASGLLDRAIGGPSVMPPQPAGVYSFTQNDKKWIAETGSSRFRRGLYTLFFRSAPYPLFTTFDAPDFQTVCTRRVRSNTPLQALTVANDEAFVEMAQGLAARVIGDIPTVDIEARLDRAFLLCLCRPPSERELAVLQGFYDRQLTDLAADGDRAAALLSTELKKSSTQAAAAALVLVCRAILNTDAFITRE
ncbi:MAG: PSD1 and planctomycete cytochrome C domain-containing protein [Pirellulaceae bacterium]